jgi:ATP:ADP antiporter, AAA family
VYSPRIAFARFVDVRPGEWRGAVLSFAVLMFASAAYTVLETARDALLVTRIPQREFGLVYIAVAACALPAASLMARVGHRLAPPRVLMAALLGSGAAVALYLALPVQRASVVALYVTAALVSSVVFPQFWVTLGTLFTVGQSRRLLGPITSASVLGSVGGSAVAAAVVPALPVRALLGISAALFVASAVLVMFVAIPPATPSPPPDVPLTKSVNAFRKEPFLLRVAVLVALTTATALVIDYFFKWTIARTMPSAERGPFIARYYVLMNSVAMIVQIFLGSAIVGRLGVATAMIITPLFSLVGGTAVLIASAAVLPVFVLKVADGSLRSSINRLTTELAYLPVSPSGREHAKPFIDGALMRIAQAVTAAALLGLSGAHRLSPTLFGAIIVLLTLAWLVAAVGMRRPYLGQLRRSVAPALADDPTKPERMDLASAELLVEHLGSDDPLDVVAAMNTLARRGRQRLIPALVLRHTDEQILERALEIFGTTTRTDWHTLAGTLLEHPSERIRIAAARALGIHGKLDARRLAVDSAPSVRGYATLHAALIDGPEDLIDDPRIAALLREGDEARLGMLAAIADAPPSVRVTSVLLALADTPSGKDAAVETDLLARATARHREIRMIPRLIARLAHRAGRESVRVALVALGEPALEEVAKALADPGREHSLRVHLPRTLARFGTKWAADRLLDCIEHEHDGQVRYKAIRALGRLVVDRGIRVDRVRVEQCVRANLASYLRLLALRVGLGAPPAQSQRDQQTTYRLLSGLLDDKLRQSLERAFRLLKIAHPKEDIHRVYLAIQSDDKRARASACEFLDALLRGRDQQSLRVSVRLICDDLPPAEQVARAAALVGIDPPRSSEDAVRALLADPDSQLASLAALYASTTGGQAEAAVKSAKERWPMVSENAGVLTAPPLALRRGLGA